MRVERCAVNHLVDGIALGQGAERQPEIKWPRTIAVGAQDGRIEEKAVFCRHLSRLQLEQAAGNFRELHLKLVGTDDQRVALLRLGIQGADAAEAQVVALCLKWPLVSRQ